MKQHPATISPRQPRFSCPTKIATSVELGPGIKFAVASRSRNSAWVIHCRRRTNSSSIIARCAAGPPNAIVPSFRNTRAISPSDASRISEDSAIARVARTLLSANSQPERSIRGYRKFGDARIDTMIHRANGPARKRREQQREFAYAIRTVRGDRDVGHLCVGEPQYVVHPGVCRCLRARLCLWVSARRLALWSGRGDLVGRGRALLVSRKNAWRVITCCADTPVRELYPSEELRKIGKLISRRTR